MLFNYGKLIWDSMSDSSGQCIPSPCGSLEKATGKLYSKFSQNPEQLTGLATPLLYIF